MDRNEQYAIGWKLQRDGKPAAECRSYWQGVGWYEARANAATKPVYPEPIELDDTVYVKDESTSLYGQVMALLNPFRRD